jgi:Zn finger protein HypA/HybF involved in hydrogenase expression
MQESGYSSPKLQALPLAGFNPMARWTLTCKQCSEEFTHSQMSESLVVFFIPEKPKFPPEGLERECPKCHAKSIYQRTELVYRKV